MFDMILHQEFEKGKKGGGGVNIYSKSEQS